jgi:hypothetical protein
MKAMSAVAFAVVAKVSTESVTLAIVRMNFIGLPFWFIN